jgi:hypothetical protein
MPGPSRALGVGFDFRNGRHHGFVPHWQAKTLARGSGRL